MGLVGRERWEGEMGGRGGRERWEVKIYTIWKCRRYRKWVHVLYSYGERICVGVGWMFSLGHWMERLGLSDAVEVRLAFSVVTKAFFSVIPSVSICPLCMQASLHNAYSELGMSIISSYPGLMKGYRHS